MTISQRVIDALDRALETVNEFQADEEALKNWVYEDIETNDSIIRLHGNPVYCVQIMDSSEEFHDTSFFKVTHKRRTFDGVALLYEGCNTEIEYKRRNIKEDLKGVKKGSVICVKTTILTTEFECGYPTNYIETLVKQYKGV